MDGRERQARWRLVMGAGSEEACGACLGDEDTARGACLDFLYNREYGGGRNVRGAGRG